MRQLPADVARCEGVGYPNEDGTMEWREFCENCMRRTHPPVDYDQVLMMEPPKIIEFWCQYHISPENEK
jgi:hypothetical protein